MSAEVAYPAWGILSQLLLVLFLGGVPLGGLPPLPVDKALVGAAPQECLLYASWYGSGEASGESKNHVERLLADPDVRRCFSTVWKELQAALRRDALGMGRENATTLSETALPLAEILLTRPGSLFVSKVDVRFDKERGGPERVDVQAGAIVNAGSSKDALERILVRLEKMLRSTLEEDAKAKEVTIDGTKFHQLSLPAEAPNVVWGFQGEYLIIGVGEGTAEKISASLKTPRGPPAWLKQVHDRLPLDRPSGVSYLNVKGIKRTVLEAMGGDKPKAIVEKVLEATGLDKVESLSSVSGLGETDFVMKTFLATEGPPRGVLDLVANKPLTAADLSAVPRDATIAMVTRFDAAKAYQIVWDLMAEIEPRAIDRAKAGLSEFEEQIGFRIREDLLEGLGDVYTLYTSPGEGGMLLGITAAINVRDRDKVEKVTDALRDMLRRAGGGDRRPSLSSARHRGQVVNVVDLGRGIPLAPTWCLTDNKLLISLYPQSIKSYLTRPAEAGSLADVPEVAAALKEQPVSLSFENTPELFRTFYPFLQMAAPMITHEMKRGGLNVDASLLPSGSAIYPHLRPAVNVVMRRDDGILSVSRQSVPGGGMAAMAPLAAAFALPAVRHVRDSTDLVKSSNNLKQLALAMHIHHDIYAALPPPANYNKDGKPLLSWRVHVLPFIEQEALYKKFKLDEPWDSEHNKKLIKEMPETYRVPSNAPRAIAIPAGKTKEEVRDFMELENYKTSYLVPVGETTLFPKGKAGELRGVRFAQVIDGTSNTVMIVEASPDKAVIWTKPDDWEFNPDKPSEGLMGYRPDGFLAAMGDASVRTIRRTLSPEALKAAFTRDGGEVIDFDDPGPKTRSLIPSAVPRIESKEVPREDSSVKPAKRAKSPKQ